ncbi:MAG: hypothetical protein AAGJ54_05350 [Planctomycetota bacterium]
MTDEFMRRPPTDDPSLPFRLTADDLISDLAWPALLRAPRLAFRPGRVGLAVVLVLALSLVDQLMARAVGGSTIAESVASAFLAAGRSASEMLLSLDVGGAIRALVVGLGNGVRSAWDDAPLRASVLLPVSVFGFAFGIVAIGRLSAEEFCRGRSGAWHDGLHWAAHCVGGIAVAYALPLVIAGIMIGVLAAGGWVLLSVPFVNIVGAALGVVGLVIAAGFVVILGGTFVGAPVFAAAMAVEGSDGVDAMHRTYAYLFARPLRYAVYSVVLVLQGVVVVSVLGTLATLTVGTAIWAESLFLGERGSLVASGVASDRLTAGGRAAASVMNTVLQLPALLVTGYAVAYVASAGTVLYLALRRLVDGQDMIDLYVPGEIDAKLDEILDRRSTSMKQAGDDPL